MALFFQMCGLFQSSAVPAQAVESKREVHHSATEQRRKSPDKGELRLQFETDFSFFGGVAAMLCNPTQWPPDPARSPGMEAGAREMTIHIAGFRGCDTEP